MTRLEKFDVFCKMFCNGTKLGQIAKLLNFSELKAKQYADIITLPLGVQVEYRYLMRGWATNVTWEKLPELVRLWKVNKIKFWELVDK